MNKPSLCASLFSLVCVLLVQPGCGDQSLPAAPALCRPGPEFVVAPRPLFFLTVQPCAGPLIADAGIAAKAGIVYFATPFDICAVDATGQGGTRALVSSGADYPVPAKGLWATDDGLLYFDGMSLRSIPASGGPITLVASMSPSFVDQPVFDGQYVYGSEIGDSNSVLHRVAVPDGTPESIYTVRVARDASANVVESAIVDKLAPAVTHLDFTEEAAVAADPKPLFRLELETHAVRSLHPLTSAGALLTADGDVTYVRAAPHPLPRSGNWSDGDVHLYRIDGTGAMTSVLPPETPPLLATTAHVDGAQIYVGGRAHFDGDESDRVILAVPSIGTGGEIVACVPGSGFVDSITTDGPTIYALVSESDTLAIVTFSR